VTKFFSIFSEI